MKYHWILEYSVEGTRIDYLLSFQKRHQFCAHDLETLGNMWLACGKLPEGFENCCCASFPEYFDTTNYLTRSAIFILYYDLC